MIRRSATTQPARGTMVFVHGLCQGAWCWDEGFLQYFSDRGYDCYAIDLDRQNGAGRSASIMDYVAQLRDEMEAIDVDPILVGHSMGGYIVQKYLEQYPCKKVVLLAPVPPNGAMAAALRVIWRHPTELVHLPTGNLRAVVASRYSDLFHPETEKALVDKYRKRLVAESFRAFVGMCWRRVRIRKGLPTSMLVIGARHDGLVSVREVTQTAEQHGADQHILEGVGHNMMLERDWEVVGKLVSEWLA